VPPEGCGTAIVLRLLSYEQTLAILRNHWLDALAADVERRLAAAL
jgi:hypothetical protein